MATERISVPFATSGDTTAVPINSGTESLDFTQGWSSAYQRPLTEAGALQIDRSQHNKLWNIITANIKQFQEKGAPDWFDDIAYTAGDEFFYTDGKHYVCWKSAPAATLPTNTDYFYEKPVNRGLKDFSLTRTSLTSLKTEVESLIDNLVMTGGETVKTTSYFGGYFATAEGRPNGGNEYEVVKATDDASRPTEDGGQIVYLAPSISEGWYLKGLFPNGVHLSQFGAIQAGVNVTTQVQNAINLGGKVIADNGTYLVDTLYVKGTSTTQKALEFIGESRDGVIFEAASANQGVFRKELVANAHDSAKIGNFTIKAHALGSTTEAIKLSGFRGSEFYRIRALSNAGAGFYSLISLQASPYLCYNNDIHHLYMDSTIGWTVGVDFNNDATGDAANNANNHSVHNCWFNGNVGMSFMIDARRSAQVDIYGNLFEQNGGAQAVKSGNTTDIHNNWFELNGGTVVYESAVDGSSNDGTVRYNYFSTPYNIDLNNCFGNLWLNNTEAGEQTFINNTFNNQKVKVSGTSYTVAIPTIGYNTGITGTLTPDSSTIVKNLNHISGDVVIEFRYTWTASSTGPTKFAVAPPTGFEFKSATSHCGRNTTGELSIISWDAEDTFWIQNQFTDACSIVIRAVYTKS